MNTYYDKPNYLKGDTEVQAWVSEATAHAQVLDFPPVPLTNTPILVDILTQVADLTGVSQNLLNSKAPSYIRGLLPFHPSTFFKPLLTEKGVQDITPWTADREHAMYQVTLQLRFQHPQLPAVLVHGELVDMFSNGAFNNGTSLPRNLVAAAGRFRQDMDSIGQRSMGRVLMERGYPRECRLCGKCWIQERPRIS